ncbi:MAG: hypothetical protein ACREQX_01050, partial [Candidatus Binataceae bacterium]
MRSLLSLFLSVLCLTGTAFAQNYAIKPTSLDGIQFVSPNGSNSNDGLSWGSAKLTIAGAVSACPTSGQCNISLSPEGISQTSSLTISRADTHIDCLKLAPITFSAHVQITISGTDVSFDGCSLVGPGAGTATSAPIVAGGNNFVFQNNVVSGFGSTSGNGTIEAIAGSHGLVLANNVSGNGDVGIFINANNGTGTTMADWRIANNEVGNGVIVHATASSSSISHVVISSNDIYTAQNSNAEFGVEAGLFGGSSVSDVNISSNHIYASASGGDGGISCVGVTQCTISGNSFDANGFSITNTGIETSGTGIIETGNSVRLGTLSSNYFAFQIGSGLNIEGAVVSGNYASASYTGTGSQSVACFTVTTSAPTTSQGISIAGNTCDVSGSTMTSAAISGVWFQVNNTSATVKNAQVSGNTLIGANLDSDVGVWGEDNAGTMSGVNVGMNFYSGWPQNRAG